MRAIDTPWSGLAAGLDITVAGLQLFNGGGSAQVDIKDKSNVEYFDFNYDDSDAEDVDIDDGVAKIAFQERSGCIIYQTMST